jgi:hypothetical protein
MQTSFDVALDNGEQLTNFEITVAVSMVTSSNNSVHRSNQSDNVPNSNATGVGGTTVLPVSAVPISLT